jgi:transcriptional regulator
MYLPEHFRADDPTELARFIQDHAFATLVSQHQGAPYASHLPVLFEPQAGAHGRLLGHMARANPQWQTLADNPEVLVIFQGPHAYVSPTLYSTPGVPTWNYATVHVYGTPRLMDDPATLGEWVDRLTAQYEAGSPAPWRHTDTERRPRLLGMIVGFEIAVTRVEGKFKLSQNRPLADQQRIARHLQDAADTAAVAVGQLMAERLARKA